MKLLSILRLDFLPTNADCGLLVLRLWFGLSLLLLHGWGKLTDWKDKAAGFADPLGVGRELSLGMTVFAEVLCALLIVVGLFTRSAALVWLILFGVAFWAVHGGAWTGRASGELAWVYLGAAVVIFVAGSGRFALDGAMGGGGGK